MTVDDERLVDEQEMVRARCEELLERLLTPDEFEHPETGQTYGDLLRGCCNGRERLEIGIVLGGFLALFLLTKYVQDPGMLLVAIPLFLAIQYRMMRNIRSGTVGLQGAQERKIRERIHLLRRMTIGGCVEPLSQRTFSELQDVKRALLVLTAFYRRPEELQFRLLEAAEDLRQIGCRDLSRLYLRWGMLPPHSLVERFPDGCTAHAVARA